MHSLICLHVHAVVRMSMSCRPCRPVQALFTSYGFQCPLLVGLLQMAIITPVRVWLWLETWMEAPVQICKLSARVRAHFACAVYLTGGAPKKLPPQSAQVCYAVARPRLKAEMFRAVMPLAVVNVANLVCGLVGELGAICGCSARATLLLKSASEAAVAWRHCLM